MPDVLGIDLGTSYSAAAVGRDDGSVEMVQLGERAASMPSVVLLRAEGEVLVGDAADRRSLTEPTRAAREFKRRLGDPVPLILGGTPYAADALVALVLRAIVDHVVREIGTRPHRIAVAHPASYGPYKLDILRAAIRQAGIADPILVAEPVAAAIHYASQERVPDGATIAVYDFGGGTFDATIVRKAGGTFDVLGMPEGLERLGGIDFDEAIFRHVAAVVGQPLQALDPTRPDATSALGRLRDECRRAKEALSTDTDTSIAVFLPGHQSEVRVTRGELEAMIEPRIGETIAALNRATHSAHLQFADLDRVLLVGGTSRIPRIAELVHDATRRPIGVDAHPKHGVALGAARSALQQTPAVAETAQTAGTRHGVPVTEPAARPLRPESITPVDSAVVLRATTPATALVPDATPAGPTPARGTSWQARLPSRPAAAIAIGAGLALALIGGVVLALGGGLRLGGPASTLPADVTAVPTLPPAPTPLPTRNQATSDATAGISKVALVGDHYAVSFTVSGFTPSITGRHVHFFWSTVPVTEAGAPGHGPWMIYGDASPFVGIDPSTRPVGATSICILVANADHTVIPGSGNCAPAP